MGKKVIKLTESDLEKIIKRVIQESEYKEKRKFTLGKYKLNEDTSLSIKPNNEGGVNINDKFAYKLQTDSWIPVGISIITFDQDTGEFELNAPVFGQILGNMAPEKIQNLGAQMAQGKNPVRFEVDMDGETRLLKFVKS